MEQIEEEEKEVKQIDIIDARSKLKDCYYETLNIFRKFLDTSEDNYKILTLWTIGTYFHSAFDSYPYLFLNAMRGSGKTRALKLISSIGSKGDGSVQNNLTEAVLFRIPQGNTTCIDEIEQVGSKEKQTLRELLNSTYKKGTKIKRMRKSFSKEGERQVTETFEPYFPIVMANIWGVEEVLADRSIVLIMEKSNNPRVVNLVEDFDRNPYISLIKRTLDTIQCSLCSVVMQKQYIERWNKWVFDRYNYTTTLYTSNTLNTLITYKTPLFDELETYKIKFNDKGAKAKLEQLEIEELFIKIDKLGINGRNLELTFPLLLIAQMIDDKVFEDSLQICSRLIGQKKVDEYTQSKDVQVYEFVENLNEEAKNYNSVKDLANRFRTFIGESDEEDKWLNDKWLGRALKRLNLIVDRRRMASGMFVTLDYNKALKQCQIFRTKEEKE